jgi:plasmid stabilization system protein ParE
VAASFKVTIAPEAVAETAAIASWWNDHRPAAPRMFQTELDRAVLLLAEQPEIAPRVRARGRPNLRVLTLRRSGYLVFYELDVAARRVTVVRVRHARRRPVHRR